MAQPAEEKDPLGKNDVREWATLGPTLRWEEWKRTDTLAIVSKTNMDLEDVLQAKLRQTYSRTGERKFDPTIFLTNKWKNEV